MVRMIFSLIPLNTRNNLTTPERILCPWEDRELLKSKINLVSAFRF